MTMQNDANDRPHILVVEDDPSLADWIIDYLVSQNFTVSFANRGDTAIELIRTDSPDLVLLDINLPKKDGFDICREVRQFFHKPILMMTARDDEMDEVLGLELGADDYITKPLRARALLARVRSLLRRNTSDNPVTNDGDRLTVGQVAIDRKSRTTKVDQQVVNISSNEFEVLWLLAQHAGEVVSREFLIQQLRGIEYDGFDRSTDILVSRLRKKLGNHANGQQRIKTIWGKGYLFSAEQ
jgi:two-component system, OmpR family, response regulator